MARGRDGQNALGGSEDWLGHNGVLRFTPGGDVVMAPSNAGDIQGAGSATRVNRAVRRAMVSGP